MATIAEEEMKVGPKGQVVIPKVMRRALNVHPGSRVIFRLEDGRLLLERAETDTVALFERIASKGRSISRIPVHAYEDELKTRE